VRGRGTTYITASDTAGQTKGYYVTVTNVIHCLGLGNSTWATANSSAAANGARIPSMGELNEIHAAYGARWPMGNHHYWSTDPSNYWWPFKANQTKYLVWGGDGSVKLVGNYSNVVAIR
jgi:hypothetical protein